MTSLQINPGTIINSILLIISIVTFVFAYNKVIRNSVDKSDLTDLKSYVDQQDRAVHHRVDETNKKVDDINQQINHKLDIIISKLIK